MKNKKIKEKQPLLYDVNGNPVKMGLDPKEGLIGPDDNPKFGQEKQLHYEMRTEDTYPTYPKEVKEVEISYVLPMANMIAQTLNIDMIDEIMYEKTLNQLRQRMLFIVMNMHNLKIQEGVAWWDGIVIMCKKHPIVVVRFITHLASKRTGIAHIKLWASQKEMYVLFGDKTKKTLITREKATELILNYLNKEGVVSV